MLARQIVKEVLEYSAYLFKMIQIQWKDTIVDDKVILRQMTEQSSDGNDLSIYLGRRHRYRKTLVKEMAYCGAKY